ncbi:MAG: phytanoyl-CoA dioxygenase family protein [candidate division Zixibacteria bacterium]|nr:phytanoyl-CoA dioxygenase family protein [candidate division Zixibacteria bacterium]
MDTDVAVAHIEQNGYCILENLLDPAEAERLDRLAQPLMNRTGGYVKLEGALNPIPDLAQLCHHPAIMEIAERLLGKPFFLANNVCMMWCQPGAPGGGLHSDWPLGGVKQPWPPWPMLLQTMWMLTDFTPDNGATRLVPGSHVSGRPPDADALEKEIPMIGKKGSVLIWHGATWHRNGPNTAVSAHRMGANAAYIPWYVYRPPEGWPLVKREIYTAFPERLQQLLERSVERG